MRKKRVRVHLVDEKQNLPSVEGLLVNRGRYGREMMIAVPRLLINPQANPADLEAKLLAIPRERIAFYEVL